jgi:hypothetical protein
MSPDNVSSACKEVLLGGHSNVPSGPYVSECDEALFIEEDTEDVRARRTLERTLTRIDDVDNEDGG